MFLTPERVYFLKVTAFKKYKVKIVINWMCNAFNEEKEDSKIAHCL